MNAVAAGKTVSNASFMISCLLGQRTNELLFSVAGYRTSKNYEGVKEGRGGGGSEGGHDG